MGPGVPEPELIPIKTNMYKADGGIWLISSGRDRFLEWFIDSVEFRMAEEGKEA